MNTNYKYALMFSFIIGLASAVTPLTAQEAGATDDEPSTVFRVYRLEHVDARDAKQTIHELMVPQTIRLSVDQRANTIMVTGDKDEVDFVFDLFTRIDVAPTRNENSEATVKTYPFPDQGSLKQGFNLIQSMLAGEPGVKMDMDMTSSNLFLQATKRQHQLALDLFEQVAQATASQQVDNVHVTTYLVVDGKQVAERAGNLKKPNSRLQPVLASAANKGLLDIAEPKVASQITSLVSSAKSTLLPDNKAKRANGYFENQSSGIWFEFQNDGTLTQTAKERFSLKSRVQINLTGPDGLQHVAEISGDIEMPLNHPVMLSFSTIGGIDSAIIIILSGE